MGNNPETKPLGDNEEGKSEVSAIDPLDKCTHPPIEDETTFLDLPFDCVGEIISFIGHTKSILSLKNSCKTMFDFFSDRNIISRVDFHYYRDINIQNKISFIYRIHIDALFVDNLRNETFQYLPNLTHLSLRRALVDHEISSGIFKYLPNLEECRITNYLFTIDESFKKLSRNIRVLSIVNLPNSTMDRKDGRPFTKVLLNRPNLTVIKLWNFTFKPSRDKKFFSKLNELENLSVLTLRSSRFRGFAGMKLSSFPPSLKDLDLNGTKGGPEAVELLPSMKKSIKRLSISNTHTNVYIQNFFDLAKEDEDHVFPSVEFLDVSSYNNLSPIPNLFDEILPKLFPNLVHLRILKITINDGIMDALMNKMKKLRRVRVSLNSIRREVPYVFGGGGGGMAQETGFLEIKIGKQIVRNISFIVY